MPARIICDMEMYPLLKTMAFGGVETGSINPQPLANATPAKSGKGGRFKPAASAAAMGRNADVVAVLLVNSARQMMINRIKQTTAGAGSEAAR